MKPEKVLSIATKIIANCLGSFTFAYVTILAMMYAYNQFHIVAYIHSASTFFIHLFIIGIIGGFGTFFFLRLSIHYLKHNDFILVFSQKLIRGLSFLLTFSTLYIKLLGETNIKDGFSDYLSVSNSILAITLAAISANLGYIISELATKLKEVKERNTIPKKTDRKS